MKINLEIEISPAEVKEMLYLPPEETMQEYMKSAYSKAVTGGLKNLTTEDIYKNYMNMWGINNGS